MSTRLTKELRGTIAERLLDRAFKARDIELAKLEKELGDCVYCHLYDFEKRQKMESLPAGFFPKEVQVRVEFRGLGYDYVSWGERRRIAYEHDNGTALSLDRDHPLSEMYAKVDSLSDSLKAEKTAMEGEILGILHSCSTLAKLVSVWPEVEEVVADLERVVFNAPVVVLSDLNKRLSLP